MSKTPSEITSANPRFGAQHIARMLNDDPTMARLVKEFISPQRLREVLDLPEDVEQLTDEHDRKLPGT